MRPLAVVLAVMLAAASGAPAQVRVRTETIRPPSPAIPYNQLTPTPQEAAEPPAPTEDPDIILDPRRLPPAVAAMRERILNAARSGDLQQLVALMKAGAETPVFSHTQRLDPTAIWRERYPDSDGIEVLSILFTILTTAPIRVDPGTPAETYLWPYFARVPLASLTPAQKIDLFRIITGSDYREMLASGHYAFYRVGIAPDGTWRYFIAGE
jgi:hypothetical protein